MASTLVTNVRIFDGSGHRSFPGEVLVQGNRIKAVAKGGEEIGREGVEVIEGRGATLMPGLVNCHGHLSYPDLETLNAIGDLPPEEHMLISVRNARTVLEHGHTAVVSAAAAKPRLDIVLRNEIEAGRVPGPRLRACTPQFNATGGPWDPRQLHMHHSSFEIIADGPIEFRRKVREMIREGVDVVKLSISGDNMSAPFADEDSTTMAEDEIAAACEVAHSRGKALASHARSDSSIALSVKYGIQFIHHATHPSERTLDLLERHKTRHSVCPALGITYVMLNEAADWGLSREWALKNRLDGELEAACETARKMVKRGIKVMPFGDYGVAWNPHGADNRDLEYFVNLVGFSPAETLTMATKWGGEAFALGGTPELGQIRPGFLADLLLIDGDPLADITLLQDRQNFLMIMKNGELYKAPAAGRRGERRRVAAE
ncbi:MAG: amidohydrolase family protein [Alphaproteobacteria bacterium]|nr:amidohydrolase family protein [Alphaproteobacteria bacterium]